MNYLINLKEPHFWVVFSLLCLLIGYATFSVPDYSAKPLLAISSIVVFVLYVRDALKAKKAKEIVEALCSTGQR